MTVCPALSSLGWIVVGAALPDRIALAGAASAFALACAVLGLGAWFGFTGFLLRIHETEAWFFAAQGGRVRRVGREEDVPADRREHAVKLTLSEFSWPEATRSRAP